MLFRRFARKYAETVPFHKISISGNQVKLRYFSQWFCLLLFDHIVVLMKLIYFLITWTKLTILKNWIYYGSCYGRRAFRSHAVFSFRYLKKILLTDQKFFSPSPQVMFLLISQWHWIITKNPKFLHKFHYLAPCNKLLQHKPSQTFCNWEPKKK